MNKYPVSDDVLRFMKEDGVDPDKVKCWSCFDEHPLSYGLAPHNHAMKDNKIVFGGTTYEPEDNWPENFIPDIEEGEKQPIGIWLCHDMCAGAKEWKEKHLNPKPNPELEKLFGGKTDV